MPYLSDHVKYQKRHILTLTSAAATQLGRIDVQYKKLTTSYVAFPLLKVTLMQI